MERIYIVRKTYIKLILFSSEKLKTVHSLLWINSARFVCMFPRDHAFIWCHILHTDIMSSAVADTPGDAAWYI